MNNSPLTRFFTTLLAIAFVVLPCADANAANQKGAKSPEIFVTDGINGMTAKSKIADYKGSPVLLVYWLPVCPRCQKFLPTVHALHKKYTAKGLKVVTVCVGKKNYTESYMKTRGYTFGVGFDWTGATKRAHGFAGTPGIRLIGADGFTRTYTGTLEAAIQEELPKKAP